MLQTVYDLGPRDFGENKVQEMCEKMEVLPKDIRWHMIGHLQTNKVKYIIGKTELIHSVDSLHLAKEIEKQAAKQNVTVSILVEVNIAEEESKFGIHKEETISLIRQIATLPHIQILGLMTIAPFVENPEDNRTYFRQIRQLSVDIDAQNIDNVFRRKFRFQHEPWLHLLQLQPYNLRSFPWTTGNGSMCDQANYH